MEEGEKSELWSQLWLAVETGGGATLISAGISILGLATGIWLRAPVPRFTSSLVWGLSPAGAREPLANYWRGEEVPYRGAKEGAPVRGGIKPKR